MSGKAVSYTIETEIPPIYLGNLIDFIYKNYLLPQRDRFTDFSRETLEEASSVAFAVSDSKGKQHLHVEVARARETPIKMQYPFIRSQGDVTKGFLKTLGM